MTAEQQPALSKPTVFRLCSRPYRISIYLPLLAASPSNRCRDRMAPQKKYGTSGSDWGYIRNRHNPSASGTQYEPAGTLPSEAAKKVLLELMEHELVRSEERRVGKE